ncbi:MAG: hypothetical protein HW421_3220 [Ignavibacteria bacterium]|nr:hypothetical protein [Ignavibacteria bacterium]
MNYKLLVLAIIVFSFFFGCKEDNTNNPSKISPKISSISPSTASIGDTINIFGSGFGSLQDSSSVIFDNKRAIEFPSWTDIQIKAIIPLGAINGKVAVIVNGVKSNELNFTIIESKVQVIIGNQVWMKRNLDVDHYRNGDPIPEVRDSAQWPKLKTGAWCYYENNSDSGKIYGKLYNWYAVNDPRGLAPAGWHVPSDAEWTTLTTFLGGDSVAGGKLKEAGTLHWRSFFPCATNESGFSALPGGYRIWDGIFMNIGCIGHWWSSSKENAVDSWLRILNFSNTNINRFEAENFYGSSVRCIKNK